MNLSLFFYLFWIMDYSIDDFYNTPQVSFEYGTDTSENICYGWNESCEWGCDFWGY